MPSTGMHYSCCYTCRCVVPACTVLLQERRQGTNTASLQLTVCCTTSRDTLALAIVNASQNSSLDVAELEVAVSIIPVKALLQTGESSTSESNAKSRGVGFSSLSALNRLGVGNNLVEQGV